MGTRHIIGWEAGQADDAAFTIAAEGATVVVSVQLKDYMGNALTVKNAVMFYMTTDAAGNVIETLGTDAVVATHGIINIVTTNSVYLCVTEDTGIFAVTLDGTGHLDNYMNVVLPNGKVVTSGAIHFSS